ncbi:MAG: BCD family MFS transporter [Pseudomonadota bacterium]
MKATFGDRTVNIPDFLLPFADAVSPELPLLRLLRLSLFQVSTGMALVLLAGTLNRVLIVELSVNTTLVALFLALPVLFAPLRALIGHKSDQVKSYLGWRRVPYLLFGTLAQFGGLAIMPFGLLLLSTDTPAQLIGGHIGAGLAFLLVGIGLHTVQTAGLALATDLAPDHSRPQVVACLYVMLLVGMVLSATVFGWLLADFSPLRLIQVIQGAAVVTIVVNFVAVWKQEPRRPELTRHDRETRSLRAAWDELSAAPMLKRVLLTVGLGTLALTMQDVLLEPYGAQILAMSVGATTGLTALLAGGTLVAFLWAGQRLAAGVDEYRQASLGLLVGITAFAMVILSAPFGALSLFLSGVFGIGFAAGLFAVSTLFAIMRLSDEASRGFALGLWGAVQATAVGFGMAFGGGLRDVGDRMAAGDVLGLSIIEPMAGYSIVYHVEILLLFVTLVIIAPLVRFGRVTAVDAKFGVSQFPG